MTANALSPGTEMAGVRITRMLGEGGFGITYEAQVLKTGATVALKEFFPRDFAARDAAGHLSCSAGMNRAFDWALQEFDKEANLLKSLPRHAHLLRVFGLFRRNGTSYIAMEFIDGKPLSIWIEGHIHEKRPIPEDIVTRIAVAVCDGLAAVHAHNHLHRDIKPANVMIRTPGDTPVLIDFGAARRRGESSEIAVMTPHYAAIEQFPRESLQRELHLEEGSWTDIYALSVMLYQMMALRLPANAKDRAAAVATTGRDPYVPIARATRGRYSERLCRAVDQGCSLMPQDRPADARTFARMAQGQSVERTRLQTHAVFGAARQVRDAPAALKRALSDAQAAERRAAGHQRAGRRRTPHRRRETPFPVLYAVAAAGVAGAAILAYLALEG